MSLLDPRTVRQLAAELDLRPTKQRGQNFVHDANTVRRIVGLAGLQDTDVVVEVGPGLGSLTLGLLAEARMVIAVEIEQKLAGQLPTTVQRFAPELADRLVVLAQDALHVQELPGEPSALVANLPYNVSVPVLLHLLQIAPTIQTGLVMVQLEVAERLVAAPGSKTYGAPSAKLAWYADATKAGTVGANVFWPVPNVESGLVRFERREPPATHSSREEVFAVVDAAFAQRRKMLRSALKGLGGPETEAALIGAGVDPTARGETLSIGDFARIADELEARHV